MLKLPYFYFLVFFTALSTEINAQGSELNFMNFGSREGLSSNIVTAMLKDKFGYMWFGTDDGLNKFDGKQFTVYRHSEKDSSSIISNEILDLHEDEKGNLWIATETGISLYNRKMDSFINFNKVISLPIISVTSVNGKLWLASYSGLILFNPDNRKASPFPVKNNADQALVSKAIGRIFKDRNNQIWIGTGTGLYLFQSKSGTFKRYFHSENEGTSLANNSVSAIAQDKSGNIWVGTNNGLSKLSPGSNNFFTFRQSSDRRSLNSNLIYSIAAAKDGKIWVGTEGGLNILNPATGEVERVERDLRNRYSLIGKAVKCILIDRDDICWVGTFRGGINKYDRNLAFFNLRQSNPFDPAGLSAPVVTSFAKVSEAGIYVGTDGGGLNYFDLRTGLFRKVKIDEGGKGNAILTMESVGDEIWIGTFLNGVFVYNTKTGSTRHVTAGLSPENISGTDVFCIRKDSRGNVWIGTNGQGVNMYDSSKKIFRRFSKYEKGNNFIQLNGYIRAIEEDHDGNILIGSRGAGISVYNPFTGQSQLLNRRNSRLPKDNINTILVSSNGTMWVGMSEGGLAYFDTKKKEFVAYTEKDGLQNEAIYKILEDNSGKIWVSTNKGVSSFDPKSKKFKNYSYYNGLQRSPFVLGAGLKLSDGTMFFGGIDGFNYVNPARLHSNRIIPRVVLTDLRIANRSIVPSEGSEIKEHISVAREIEIDYKQNFSLSFTALNFTSPHENRYMYKMERFERDWNNVGANNTAVYTNLDPGKYTFYVKAVSESGEWKSPVTSIVVYVRPPFWRTYYAYAFYILLAASILWYTRRRGIKKLEAKFSLEQERLQVQQLIEQERREAERLHEFDQLKIKFLTNLSHEFRTPISLIMGPVEQLLQQESVRQKADKLNMVRRNARRLLNLVNQLLDFRNMEEKELKLNTTEGDFIAFARDVAESFRDLSARKQINFEFRSDLKYYFTLFDHEKVERVLFNLLSNAFKFTLQGGEVVLKIERADNATGLKICLTDTGIGIEEDARDRIFERFFQTNASSAILNQGSGIGLSITKEFVKMHGGTIEVESISGKGSTFTIHFPFESIKDESPVESNFTVQPHDLIDTVPNEDSAIPYAQLPVILLVEDNDDFRFYLKDNLKTFYRIVEATNGKEGWQKVLSSHPQLVVSDISMPLVSGIDLCKKIKADKRTSHIPVLLLTALTGEETQLEGLETGANDYMTKPFNFEILNVKIRNLLTLNERLKNTYTKQLKVSAPEVKVESDNEKLLSKVIQYIDTNLTNPQLSVEDLSKKVGMSRGSLYTKVLELTGETPVEFIRSVKLDRAAVLLEKSDMNIAQVSYSVGFSTPNYFARAFKTKFNMLPSEYIQLKRSERTKNEVK
ncbi:hybrid sensor histidine kinase/response regulator transcription factor [Desertivirga brevis]|uniref:hybrid sensor histidine kinase/response regulator transcription factor n=1 Tax=Desertivirga brevis TaxID=2810310 RepID=UPI001A96B859|nr:hybrid sensor histidine kinase/response regulator transcription factor [Pedobacter sp. SYSU D00873]